MLVGNKDTEWKVYEETLADGSPRLIIAQSINVAGQYACPDSVGLKEKSHHFAFPEEFVKEMHDLYHECYENNEVAKYPDVQQALDNMRRAERILNSEADYGRK